MPAGRCAVRVVGVLVCRWLAYSGSPVTKSFAGAEEIAEQHPQYAGQITAAAKESFLDGADWAYTAGIVAMVLGAALVFLRFPRREEEQRLLAQYHAEDT